MAWRPDPDSEVRLFRDMTSPMGGAPKTLLGFADDPMDEEGYVHISDRPGLGLDINWDYIEDNFLPDLSSKNINFIG